MISGLRQRVDRGIQDQRGVTLIELLIVMIIIAILSVVIFVSMTASIEGADAAGQKVGPWSMTIKYDPDAIRVVGADPGDPPFDSQPDVVIDNTLGVATMSSDTTGVGAGDGDYTFAVLKVEGIGAPGFTEVDVTNVEVRDKTGVIIPGVTATAAGVTISGATVPSIGMWAIGPLAGVLALLVLWQHRRRREWAAEHSR